MNKELENIIRNNDFAELTAEQKSIVSEWATSEEEYSTMKQIIASAPLLNSDVAPSPNLKNSLMETFAATYPSGTAMASGGGSFDSGKDTSGRENRKVIFMWLRAGVAVAAVLLAVLLVYPLFNSSDENSLVAQNDASEQKSGAKKVTNPTIEEKTEVSNETVEVETNEVLTDNSAPSSLVTRELSSNDRFDANGGSDDMSEPMVLEEVSVEMPLTNSGSTVTELGIASANYYTSFSSSSADIPIVDFKLSEDVNLNLDHSDMISVADLPEKSRQVIHERPELLDLLHTSY